MFFEETILQNNKIYSINHKSFRLCCTLRTTFNWKLCKRLLGWSRFEHKIGRKYSVLLKCRYILYKQQHFIIKTNDLVIHIHKSSCVVFHFIIQILRYEEKKNSLFILRWNPSPEIDFNFLCLYNCVHHTMNYN